MRFTHAGLGLVLLGVGTATAQTSGGLRQRLDALAGAGVAEQRAVGIVAAAVKGKDTLLLQAYGKADVEADAAMAADTVIPIGSVTKQFTAAAILQLRDAGKLGLDDPLTKWLPDFETRGNTSRCGTSSRTPRARRREGERDDLRGLRRAADLRATGHDPVDVLQRCRTGRRPCRGPRDAERPGAPRAGHRAHRVVLTNSEPDTISATTEAIAAAVLPAPDPVGPFTGEAALLAGTYGGPGRGKPMTIDVTQSPTGFAVAIDGGPPTAATWARDWTLRRGDALVILRRTGNPGPATELRFDTAAGHFILKRQ